MNKLKIYLVLGWILVIIWSIITFLGAAFTFTQLFGRTSTIWILFRIISIMIVAQFLYNPLFLIGALFLWRADKNENSLRKSKWGWLALISISISFLTVLGAFTIAAYYGPSSLHVEGK